LPEDEEACRVRAWIGRMGEQPLANLFAVELDEEVAPTASGATTGADVDPIRRSELAAQLKSCIRATGMMPLGYISNFSFGLIA